jgi:DNA-binding LacI/PurR family transcriptional regulator
LAGNQNHIVNRNRYEGFLKAHRDLNLDVDEALVFLDMNNKMLINRVVSQILERGADCIICSDDFICSRVLAKLEEDNIAVPDQIKIASFYNSSQLESHNPPVTALSINVKELGITAGKHLIEMISGETVEHKSLINYEIILKRSTS